MSIKVLVTGANGQLGKTIEELFADNNDNIHFTFASKEALDITDQQQVTSFIKKSKFDYCINCAAYTNVEQAEKTPKPAYLINSEAVKYLAEASKAHNVVLIHISTDYVFDGIKNQPYTVNDKTNPINEYGKSKLLGEQYIAQTMDAYFIIRTSWLYSKKYGKNFYKTVLNKAKAGERLSITSAQKSCPTNTISISNFIYEFILSSSKNYGLYHFSDETEMTWYDFAKEIAKENDIEDTKIERSEAYKTFAQRPRYSVLNNNNNKSW
ncbi:dTDP-4-dehydrorhamnose reductase [Hyunsoonleella rubra]|uniref:dTDP-4-dehydrorhamnose reductase n=1 Tax=Hyunsoonleella rubra TaxID=1737062 RepID=A0ABW5T8J2_9FLAO